MNSRGSSDSQWILRAVVVLWLVSAVLVSFLFARIDAIVQGQLYDYGLQFSFEWVGPYWGFLRFAYVCLGVPFFMSAVALGLSFRQKKSEPRAKAVPEARGRQVHPPKVNHMVVNCPKCNRVFSRALVMLDFSDGKTRLVSVCPYCNHVLGSTEISEVISRVPVRAIHQGS